MNSVDQFRKDIDKYFNEYGFVAEIFLEKYTQKLKFSSFQEALEIAKHVFDNPEIYPEDVKEIVTQEVCDSVAYAIENMINSITADRGVNLMKARNQKKFLGHKLATNPDFAIMLAEKWDLVINEKHFLFMYVTELPVKDVVRTDALAALIAYIAEQTEAACRSFLENNTRYFREGPDLEEKGYILQLETFVK